MPNQPENVTMKHGTGVIAVNGEPVLRMATTAQAGIFLSRLGYRAEEYGGLWTFWKPAPRGVPGVAVPRNIFP